MEWDGAGIGTEGPGETSIHSQLLNLSAFGRALPAGARNFRAAAPVDPERHREPTTNGYAKTHSEREGPWRRMETRGRICFDGVETRQNIGDAG